MLTRTRTLIPYAVKHKFWQTRLSVRSLTGVLRMSPSFLIIGTQKGRDDIFIQLPDPTSPDFNHLGKRGSLLRLQV